MGSRAPESHSFRAIGRVASISGHPGNICSQTMGASRPNVSYTAYVGQGRRRKGSAILL